MAKFAQVGYGSNGEGTGQQGTGYTYVVNDNVRTGDIINPSVVHYSSKKIYATTGKVISRATKLENMQVKDAETGKLINTGKVIAETLKDKGLTEQDLADVKTGKELGLQRERTAKGTFAQSSHDANGDYVASKYEQAVRGANILERQAQTGNTIAETEKAQKSIETFDSYSKQFM
jgi:hypothetical protein